jgi:alkylation response protein AidB-like acyl-CoA dehydrogenase
MTCPGVDIRPIRNLNGVNHYCEVFYDEVRIPLDRVVGQLHDGWSVAMSTLGFERGTAFLQAQTELSQTVENLIEMARHRRGYHGRRLLEDDATLEELATLRTEVAAMRAMTYAGVSRSARQAVPGPEGSMLKLYRSELQQRVAKCAMEVRGIESLEVDGVYLRDSWVRRYLLSYEATIGGGTSEVQRNIIGDRVLGLPR